MLLKNEGETKTSKQTKKLRKRTASRSALRNMLKEVLREEANDIQRKSGILGHLGGSVD